MREQMWEEMDEKGGVGVGSGKGSENNGRVCKGELQNCHTPIFEILSLSLLCTSLDHTHTERHTHTHTDGSLH